MTIRRRTRNGAIELQGSPLPGRATRCGCGAETGVDREPLIGVRAEVGQGPHDGRMMDLAICGTCLSSAIAIHLARMHVAAGGRLEEITDSLPETT